MYHLFWDSRVLTAGRMPAEPPDKWKTDWRRGSGCNGRETSSSLVYPSWGVFSVKMPCALSADFLTTFPRSVEVGSISG